VLARVIFGYADRWRHEVGGGNDPKDADEGDEAEGEERVAEAEPNRDEVEQDRDPVFAFGHHVLALETAGPAEMVADGEAKDEKAGAGEHHGDDIDADGEGIHLVVEDVGGEERQKGKAEEKDQIGVEDTLGGLVGAVNQVVMIDPVDAGEDEGEQVDGEGGKDGDQASKTEVVGDLEIEHHDGDDDGDDAVGEGFEPGWRGVGFGHDRGQRVACIRAWVAAYNVGEGNGRVWTRIYPWRKLLGIP
jgi:hypothetical protein